MKHRNSHLLVGYWSRLRAGRTAPDQADLDPRALKRILSHVFILDSRHCARPEYRLAGTALCDRFGHELRGTGFFAHWERGAHERLAGLLARALASGQPLWLSAVGTASRRAVVELETVLAPLAYGTAAPQRFLGITQVLGDLAQLGGCPILSERLIEWAVVREDEIAESADPPPPPPSLPSRRSEFPARRTPHLRLVVSHEPPTLHCDGAAALLGRPDPYSAAGC